MRPWTGALRIWGPEAKAGSEWGRSPGRWSLGGKKGGGEDGGVERVFRTELGPLRVLNWYSVDLVVPYRLFRTF